jgi:Fe-S-cluster-containing dehydrogenase component
MQKNGHLLCVFLRVFDEAVRQQGRHVPDGPLPLGAENASFAMPFCAETINLPRQARDRRRLGKTEKRVMRFCRRCVNSAPWRHCPAALAPRDGKGATWQRAPRGSGNRTCLLQCHFRLRTIVYQDRLGTNILQAGKTQTRDAFLQSDRRAAEAWGFCVSKHCALTATSTIVPVRTTTLLNVLQLAIVRKQKVGRFYREDTLRTAIRTGKS